MAKHHTFKDIEVGDRVTILTPQKQERIGTAVILSHPSHVALNMGGPHGTPGVVTPDNFVWLRKGKN